MNRDELLKRCHELIDLLDEDDLTSAIENMEYQLEWKRQADAYGKRIAEGRIHYYDGEYYTREAFERIKTAIK